MFKKEKHFAVALLALVMVMALVGCSKKEAAAGSGTAAAAAAENIDLGGFKLTVGSWHGEDPAGYEPGSMNPLEPYVRDAREATMKAHNFDLRFWTTSDWGTYVETISTSTLAGNPTSQIYFTEVAMAVTLLSQNLLAPLDTKVFDNTDVPWDRSILETFTFGGKPYAFQVNRAIRHMTPLYWNKRLFEEAGIDPDLPYQLQKSGQWTWDAFLDLCNKLTRDTNNDGVIDVYALTYDGQMFFDAVVPSNGAKLIDKDANGKFVNATTRPEFAQAVQFINTVVNGGYKYTEEGVDFRTPFYEGKAAMHPTRWFVGSQVEFQQMQDDWGMVVFPKGPAADGYHSGTESNVMVVSAAYSPEEVDKIMTAYYLYQQVSVVAPDEKKALSYASYRDTKAVDETLPILESDGFGYFRNQLLIPGLNYYEASGAVGQANLGAYIESFSARWQTLLDEYNNAN
jgi:ABC-type glycerol-3-phosphate transport system substrate-binding protein